MNICIVGFGETGVTIASLINAQKSGVVFNVLDPSEYISGRVLDLKHAIVDQNNELHLNNFNSAANADFLFYCAGVRNEKGADRSSVVKANKDIIRQVFDNFDLKNSCKIIVVTNPVELISQWISECFNHQLTVVGTGTGLDTVRLISLLSEQLKIAPDKIETSVIGEHGSHMVPVYSRTTINKRPLAEYLNSEGLLKLTSDLKGVATEIRKTEEATKFGVGQFAVGVMNRFLSSVPTIIPLSVCCSEAYQKELAINEKLFLSLPCKIANNTVEVVSPIKLNKEELTQFQKAVQELLRINKSVN